MAQATAMLRVGALSLDARSHRVWVDSTEIALSVREFRLLEALMTRRDRVLRRQALLEIVWGGADVGARSVDAYVTRVRRKLGSARDEATCSILFEVDDPGQVTWSIWFKVNDPRQVTCSILFEVDDGAGDLVDFVRGERSGAGHLTFGRTDGRSREASWRGRRRGREHTIEFDPQPLRENGSGPSGSIGSGGSSRTDSHVTNGASCRAH